MRNETGGTGVVCMLFLVLCFAGGVGGAADTVALGGMKDDTESAGICMVSVMARI
ncbi:hypothetical protein [Methanogenium cariaci]|uniref:hypothetical protein n=1 Tax=Methanogenium cariaci TaxID=2197 RepID=UPI0012F64395|nr:hypothetical protein [Methanogenium cariaci]